MKECCANQHVIQRGNNRDIIFVSDDDYRFYLEKLDLACARFGCALHAYVLMTNYVHLLLTPTTNDASLTGVHEIQDSIDLP